MANEKRIRNNNVQGTLSSTMNSTGTTINSAGLANLEAISSTEHAAIVIDPGRTAGAPEIVHVTAHTGSATSATIVRGREGSAARAHSSTEQWVHAPTATIDFLPFRPPSARVERAAAQSMASGAFTAIQFDTEKWDTDSMWSSTLSERVHVRTAGKYLATFQSLVPGTTAGSFRSVAIVKNSTSVSDSNDMVESLADGSAFDTPFMSVAGMFEMTTSDWLSAQIFTGSVANTSTALRRRPKFSVLWVSS